MIEEEQSQPQKTSSESDQDLSLNEQQCYATQPAGGQQMPSMDLLHTTDRTAPAAPQTAYRSYMSDFDPTRELHLCWQDTIEEVSLEDDEFLSSADSIKVKSALNREKAVSSRKSACPDGKVKSGSKNAPAASSHSKLILPKNNFAKTSKSCKTRGGTSKPSEGQPTTKVRTAYNAYSSTSRLSGQSGSTKTTKANLRKTSGSMQTTAASASISNTDYNSAHSSDAFGAHQAVPGPLAAAKISTAALAANQNKLASSSSGSLIGQ